MVLVLLFCKVINIASLKYTIWRTNFPLLKPIINHPVINPFRSSSPRAPGVADGGADGEGVGGGSDAGVSLQTPLVESLLRQETSKGLR